MTYLAIDLEMTGLNVKRDHILEIGALRMKDGKPTGEFSALINPHCAVPETITDLTGITQEMADSVRSCPMCSRAFWILQVICRCWGIT